MAPLLPASISIIIAMVIRLQGQKVVELEDVLIGVHLSLKALLLEHIFWGQHYGKGVTFKFALRQATRSHSKMSKIPMIKEFDIDQCY